MKKKKEIIVKSNYLIEARYRLSLQEMHVVFWLLSQIQPDEEDFKNHRLKISDFADMLGVSADNQYSKLRAVTKRLMKRVMEIYHPEEELYLQVSWLSAAMYECKGGYVSLEFSPHLKPYLLQLKGQFTKFNLSDVLGLKSIYSIRIFELLLQRKKMGNRTISIDDLRSYCQEQDNTRLEQYKDFKKRAIERAKKEINEKTKYEVDYKEIKESRKVVALEWTIKNKDVSEMVEEENGYILEKEYRSPRALLYGMEEYGFSQSTARKFLRDFPEETIINALKAVGVQVAKGNVKNPGAMLRKAIQEGWKSDQFKAGKKEVF